MKKYLLLFVLLLVSCTGNKQSKEEQLVLSFLEDFQSNPLDGFMKETLQQHDLYKMLEVSPKAKRCYTDAIKNAHFKIVDVTNDYSDHLLTVTVQMEVFDVRKEIAANYLNDCIKDFTAFDFHNLFDSYGYDEYVEAVYFNEDVNFIMMAEKNIVKNQLYKEFKEIMANNILDSIEPKKETIKYRLEFIVDKNDHYIVDNYTSTYDFRPALGFYMDENEIVTEFLEVRKDENYE